MITMPITRLPLKETIQDTSIQTLTTPGHTYINVCNDIDINIGNANANETLALVHGIKTLTDNGRDAMKGGIKTPTENNSRDATLRKGKGSAEPTTIPSINNTDGPVQYRKGSVNIVGSMPSTSIGSTISIPAIEPTMMINNNDDEQTSEFAI
jgi:hypothetical protein